MARSYKYYFTLLIAVLCICNTTIIGNEIEITERLSEYIPENIFLVNEEGKSVDFLEQLTMPTVISLVYFNCPGICTPLLNEIQSIIENSELKLGKDYQFLTISFDPAETTELAVNKKSNYLKDMTKRNEAESGWKFFTGDSLNLAKALNSLGYGYKKVGSDYIHKACMIIANSEGKIIRYNMGITMLPLELKISVIEANKGNVLPKTYKKDEYCFPYVAPAYKRLNRVATIFGILTISLALLLFMRLLMKPKPFVKS